eukprot:TRINITY_DN1537_c0_g1_i1.p3 TRINITY_DN1537_c0_g1~~TRINITY_DN1537_c0_g1_i1.p3  ORF type:complete len:153 (+),score=36.00 TRINITY_DN1537_c0_g1_i1:365-823(+)
MPEIPSDKIRPTVGLNVCKIDANVINLRIWDLGGEESLWSMWPKYYSNANGIIFVIDASNANSVRYSKQIFEDLANQGAFLSIPVLLVANKSDLGNTWNANDIREIFEINDKIPGQLLDCRVETCSCYTGEGIQRGIEWICEYMKTYVNLDQ